MVIEEVRVDPASGAGEEPATTRRGGLLVCLFGLALMGVDIGLVVLFVRTHTRMVGLMLAPAAVGLLFSLAGLNALVRPRPRKSDPR
jgi:hypothetical protein